MKSWAVKEAAAKKTEDCSEWGRQGLPVAQEMGEQLSRHLD